MVRHHGRSPGDPAVAQNLFIGDAQQTFKIFDESAQGLLSRLTDTT